MNIVLVHPYIRVKDKTTFLSEPMGLMCLATYVKKIFKNEINISILDLYALGAETPIKEGNSFVLGLNNEEEICSRIRTLKPDLIGITCNFTAYFQDSIELVKIFKKKLPNTPIVMGGAHVTIEAYDMMKNYKEIDFIICNEGEIAFEKLIRALSGKIEFSQCDNLIYRDENKCIKVNQVAELIKDLSILPTPDRTFIDMEKYKVFNRKTIWYAKKKPVATIMTSRGCPYSCVFCSTKVMWKRKWRGIPLKKVFKEIENLYYNYGIREIVINDDQFMISKKRINEFCDYFIEKKLNLSFAVDAGISPWLIDKDLMIKMRKAGYYSFRFPIESGCPKTIQYIKKPINLDKTKEVIEDAMKLGFWTSANIIIGFPDETKEEIKESIDYVYNSSLDFTSFLIAKPNAGSEMYEDFKTKGLLKKNLVQGSDFYRSDYDTSHLTSKELSTILKQASNRWFIHKIKFYMKYKNFKKYLLPKIKNFDDLKYFIKVLFVVPSKKIFSKLWN